MWGKLLKFPAHPPYKPIRSTHEQRSETGASKRTKISCGSRSGVVRGRQGSSGVVRGRQGSSGVVRGRQGSSGVVRGRQGSSGVVRVVRVVRGRQGSSGVVRGRQGSSGVVRGRQGSSGVVRGRQESSGVVSDRGRQSRQESSAKIGQLLLPSLMLYIYIYVYIYIYYIAFVPWILLWFVHWSLEVSIPSGWIWTVAIKPIAHLPGWLWKMLYRTLPHRKSHKLDRETMMKNCISGEPDEPLDFGRPLRTICWTKPGDSWGCQRWHSRG